VAAVGHLSDTNWRGVFTLEQDPSRIRPRIEIIEREYLISALDSQPRALGGDPVQQVEERFEQGLLSVSSISKCTPAKGQEEQWRSRGRLTREHLA